MHKTIGPKAKKKLDLIQDLKNKITDWKNYSDEEIFKLIKEFEKRPRDEVSFWYNEALSDNGFANTLLAIAMHYQTNAKLNADIVRALGYMIKRYQLTASDEIFNYFLQQSQRKGTALYVSFFLPYLPQFEDYKDKWQYLMSIKDIKPAKEAEDSFRSRIKHFLNQLPREYKIEAAAFFEQAIQNKKSDYSKDEYRELINQLKET